MLLVGDRWQCIAAVCQAAPAAAAVVGGWLNVHYRQQPHLQLRPMENAGLENDGQNGVVGKTTSRYLYASGFRL